MRKRNKWKPETDNKTLPTRLPQWRDSRKKHSFLGGIKALLGKDFELQNIMKFFEGIGMFDEI